MPSLKSAPASADAPTSFILPDLLSYCTYPDIYHADGDAVAQESVDWLDSSCPDLSSKQRKALHGLQAGRLASYAYHAASTERLRIISDYVTYLFHLDNISDGMMTRETEVLSDSVMNALWFSDRYRPTRGQPPDELNAGKLMRDYWARLIPGAGPGTQARFKEAMALFFEAVNVEAKQRDTDAIPDLESFIALRRDTSGCKSCWVLIEYGLDIDLPDYVVADPVMQALNKSTNDLVTWSNDIYSYNVEQARGDTHNMVVILMTHHGHSLQGAIDFAGGLCRQAIDAFQRDRAALPSWGPAVDDMVRRYVRGLEAWMVGSIHWSFMTERYFGKAGAEVKKDRCVELLLSIKERLSLFVNCPVPFGYWFV
ncbi:terpenoid synthase [Mycena pura]|uniref:Terpene synthase n=1 Tax=Mycena pura TaxID=153505 RepID=A0AAD6UWY9_9AGAR|nr:terpenoid synthase [Mycena pura]